MLEALSMPFMQRAVLAGMLVAVLGGYYGVFIVQRGMSFMGSGLSHAAFGGVALGLLLGVEPMGVAVPFTIATALGITWLRRRTVLGEDTAIGIFFSVSMALGIVFLSLRQDFTTEAFSYLFGSILAVTPADLWATGLFLLFSLFTLPVWSRWAYATFDRELALADRLPVDRDDYLLSVLIAVTVVLAVKLLGIMLVVAFLVVPAATARMLARSFFRMSLLAVGIGMGTTLLGLFVSYTFDLPSGAAVILVQALLFFLSLPFNRR